MAPRAKHRPGLLLVLDGFAFGDPTHPCNAVARARTPTLDRLRRDCPVVELECSGAAVGLPPGQMGNSEVGHLNIGAGRVVHQDFMRINQAIRDDAFGARPAFKAAVSHVRRTRGRLHLVGLIGPGGVHAHASHWAAALEAAAAVGVNDVWLHPIGDGRDTPPQSAEAHLRTLEGQVQAAGVGRIADFVGRYYAMDRDNRWERVEAAYRLYKEGKGRAASDVHAGLRAAYAAGETDEFVKPISLDSAGTFRSGDAIFWLNFRPDRSRQMARAFMDPNLEELPRRNPTDLLWLCMTRYDATFTWPGIQVAFPPETVPDCLAEHLSKLGLTQFHTAETEKYAHVTYFLNGGHEPPFPGEDRHLVPSPKVATYDLQPEMSAHEVTDRILLALGSGGYDFVVANFANPDMVGHTGKLDATVRAVEAVDGCLDRITQTAAELGFVTLITADHGNAEVMCKPGPHGEPGDPLTQHTTTPVPLILVGGRPGETLREGGRLANVAPTLLDLMRLPIPAAMTEGSLVERAEPTPGRETRHRRTQEPPPA